MMLIRRALGLLGSGLLPGRYAITRSRWRRVALTFAILALTPFAILYYALGYLVDGLFFRGYRTINIHRPVMILGVPRSGTTALHQTLAKDPQFTTQRLWECLFAPTISHRYALTRLARLDQRMGGFLRRFAGWLNRRAIAPLSGAHPLATHAPEEDYLTLLASLQAFILILLFPDSRWLWRLGRGDEALTTRERKRLMASYRRSIQRHLYFHGQDKTYLAKNASFATLTQSLIKAFPDARLIACLREPAGVVSSQIASLVPALEALHGPIQREVLTERLLIQLQAGYRSLLSLLPQAANTQAVFVGLKAQREQLSETLTTVYATLELELDPALQALIEPLAQQARAYQSGHQHRLADYQLDSAHIARTFGDITDAFDFDASQPIVAQALPALAPARRIVVVSDAIPERNGVGTYYNDLVMHLRAHGEQITLIAPQAGDVSIAQWASFGLPGDSSQALGLPSPMALRASLDQLSPTHLIVATPGPYGVLASYAARSLGAALIVGLHTDCEALAKLYWGPVRGRINETAMRGINRWLFRRAQCVVSNSAPMHKLARRHGARRSARVTTPVAPIFLDTPPAALNIPPQRLLFVGRLAAEKRIESVIEAARRHPNWQMSIAGDGPLRESVIAAAHELDNLVYLGWLTREALVEQLDEHDCLALPSQVEAFGTVALEALARGRITLVSEGCGIIDWPELYEALWVIGPEESLADALQRLNKTDRATLQSRAHLGRVRAQQMANRCVDEWLELLG